MANIIKRVWNQNRMVQIEDLKGMTFQAEAAGHTFQISGIDDDGNTVALTGTPSGVLLRPDNTDVALTCSVSGGVVSATLPANCYDVPGRFGLTIFITSGSSKTAIYAAVGTVTRTSSGTVAPGTSQSVVDLINAINAAVNSIPASYSALLADIAPTYSDSALYSVGQYAWYDGDLKRCIVQITTAESYTAAHWTSAVLGQDVSDLKSAFIEKSTAEYGTINIGTLTSGYYVKKADGRTTSSSSWSCTDYLETDFKALLFTCAETSNNTQLNNVAAVAFYTSATNSAYISGSAVSLISGTSGNLRYVVVTVPATAKYFRASILNSISSNYTFIGIKNFDDFKEESLIQRGSIPGGADLDDYTTAGMWIVTSVPDPAISNWPSADTFPNVSRTGRLFVYGNATDAISMRVQMIVDGNNNFFVRRGVNSETWTDWVLLAKTADVDNLNDLLMGIPTRNIMDEFPQDERKVLNVTITQTGSGEYHLNGTKSGSSTPRILLCGGVSSVPGKFSKGKKYSIFVKAYDAFVWISAYFNNSSSGAVTLFRSESGLHGEQNATFTIPSDATGIAVTIRLDDAASFNEDVSIYIVEVASNDKKQAITEAVFAGSFNDRKLFSVGNSFLTGICTENNVITETCPYKDAPYAQIAMMLGISEDNVNHVVHTNTAFAWPSTTYDSHSDVILATDLSGYDYVLSHFNGTDLKKELGTVNADGTGDTLADAVVRVVNYIKTSKYICKLILLGTPPYSSQVAGVNIFTSPQGTLGNTLDDMDNLMSALALKYHFIYVGWQDLELSYHYMDFADDFVDPNVDARHLTSVDTYRVLGEYAANQIMAVNSPIAVSKLMNSMS